MDLAGKFRQLVEQFPLQLRQTHVSLLQIHLVAQAPRLPLVEL